MAFKHFFKRLVIQIMGISFLLGCFFIIGKGSAVADPLRVKMYEKKNAVLPNEVLNLKFDQKKLPGDFVKLENKNFTIFYPKCFELVADMDEDGEGVSKAPGVGFYKKDKCDNYKAKDDKHINVGTSWSYKLKSLESAYPNGHLLLKQKMRINDIDALMITFARDDSTEPGRKPYMRREIYMICDEKTYKIVSDAPIGSVSEDLIAKENYGFPEVFMQMIATFKCK